MNTILERKIHPQHFSPPLNEKLLFLVPPLEVRSNDVRATVLYLPLWQLIKNATPLNSFIVYTFDVLKQIFYHELTLRKN